MSKRLKQLPLMIMLIAGAFTSIVTFALKYETVTALWILFGVLVLFYILGTVVQKIIFKFEEEIAEKEAKLLEEEGKVVEKDGVVSENTETDDEYTDGVDARNN